MWPICPLEYVIPHHKLATPDLLGELKGARNKILVWTVNASAGYEAHLPKLGVEGIISDETGLLCSDPRN